MNIPYWIWTSQGDWAMWAITIPVTAVIVSIAAWVWGRR